MPLKHLPLPTLRQNRRLSANRPTSAAPLDDANQYAALELCANHAYICIVAGN